jgi:hypothetical protein
VEFITKYPTLGVTELNPHLAPVSIPEHRTTANTKFDSNSIISLITNIDTLSPNIRFILTTRDNETIIESFLNDSEIISLSDQYFG